MATTPRQFRLPDETVAELDALAEHLGLPNRSVVIRLAVKRMARAELGTLPGDRSKADTKRKKGK